MTSKKKLTLDDLAELYHGDFASVAYNFAEEVISLWRPHLKGQVLLNTSVLLKSKLLKRTAQMDTIFQLLTFQLEEGLIKKCASQQIK